MSGFKLDDILKQKQEGDEWYSFQMPEEFHIWTLSNEWKGGVFKKYNLKISTLSVSGAIEIGKAEVKYNHRAPLILDCGIDIRKGQTTTSTTHKASFGPLNADSAVEVNEILKELSHKYKIPIWTIRTMRVYVPDGRELHFKIHSPNGTGSSLYFWRLKDGDRDILYSDVSLNEQQNLTSLTHMTLAHCTAVKQEGLGHACKLLQMKAKEIKKSRNKTSTKWIKIK